MSSPRDWLRNYKKHRQSFSNWAFACLLVAIIARLFFSPWIDGEAKSNSFLRWFVLVAGVVIVGGLAYFWRAMRQAAQLGAENDAALRCLRAGDYEGARSMFTALAFDEGGKSVGSLVALVNLALTEQSLGNFAAAREHLLRVDATCKPMPSGSFYTLVPSRLAFVEALAGRLGEVVRWLEESRRRAENEHTNTAVIRVFETGAQAVLDCRRGEPGRAVAELEARWREIDSSATGEFVRPLRVIRAFALDAASSGRESEKVAAILAPLNEFHDRQLVHLGDAWPEMRAFLLRHAIT